MPAGMVRPRASLVAPLGLAEAAEYLTHGWQVTADGRPELGNRVGPCARCRRPCVRYGPTGQPLCLGCR